jgi:hypothetical protein
MKNVLFILSVILLCSVTGAAQKIDKAEFEKLVDYVNCKLTAEYIEIFRDDDNEKGNIKKYDDKIKKELSSCTREKSLSIVELESILTKNGWSKTYNALSKSIDLKKEQFSGMPDKDAIELITNIDNISALKATNIKLSKVKSVAEDIKKGLYSDYKISVNNNRDKSAGKQKTETEQAVDGINKKIDKTAKGLRTLNIFILATCIAILAICSVILYLLHFHINRLTAKLKKQDGIEKINDLLLGKIAELLDRKLESLRQEPLKQNTWSHIPVQNFDGEDTIPELTADTPSVQDPAVKYVGRKQGKGFYNLSDCPEGCDFAIFNIKGNSADFKFCGDNQRAMDRLYMFDDVCDITKRSAAPTNIMPVEAGKVTWKDNHWEVTERAKIKII